MPLRDLLKKKDKIEEFGATNKTNQDGKYQGQPNAPPEFTFLRTTTDMQEIISPPSFPADNDVRPHLTKDKRPANDSAARRLFHRRKKAPEPQTSSVPPSSDSPPPSPPKVTQTGDGQQNRLSKRLEEKLHIRSHSRTSSAGGSSVHVPSDLPDIEGDKSDNPPNEAEWEKRALLLASQNDPSRPTTPSNVDSGSHRSLTNTKESAQKESTTTPQQLSDATTSSRGHSRSISNAEDDINIQEAIRLHEAGGEDLERSTKMLRRLADEQNNAMAQVLYGLALRHGWGCTKDEPAALRYLSQAASNSALVEAAALSSGTASSRGGPAKGELVLAIYELGNSFRWGWGCEKDPFAARKYYETAANLGDTDAMAEVAWCYLEGFGGPKDKFMAAKYLRMAESKGVKEPGNSWIWKEKYNSREGSEARKKDKKEKKASKK